MNRRTTNQISLCGSGSRGCGRRCVAGRRRRHFFCYRRCGAGCCLLTLGSALQYAARFRRGFHEIQRYCTEHKQHRKNSGRFHQERSSASSAEHSSGNSAPSERSRQSPAFSGLKENGHDQCDAHQNMNKNQQSVQHYSSFRIFLNYAVFTAAFPAIYNPARIIPSKDSASSEAPPIKPPSISGCARSSRALEGFMLPPY